MNLKDKFKDKWDNSTSSGKIRIIIGACCIGIIILAVIGGIATPDQTTNHTHNNTKITDTNNNTTDNTNNTNTITNNTTNNNNTNTSKRIYIDTSYKFTYHSFDSAPGKANYFESVAANDDVFYFTSQQEYVMMEYSPIFNQMQSYGYHYEFDDDVDITNVFGGKVGGLHKDKGVFSFSVSVDKKFSFTYTGGHQVGLNDDAKEIETIYDANGTVIYPK